MAPVKVVVVVVGVAGVEGAASEGALLFTGVLRLPRERPVEPVSVPPMPRLLVVVPSLSVLLLVLNKDPPPNEDDPVSVVVAAVAAGAVSVAGFVSVRIGLTSVVVVLAVPSGFEVPVLNKEVPEVDPSERPVGAVVVGFSGVVVDEKNDVIPGCLPPPSPLAAGAVVVLVVPLAVPRPLERLEKLVLLGKEELAAEVPNDKLVLTFGFVVPGLELPDAKENAVVAAGVVVEAPMPKVGAAVVVVDVVEGSPDVMPVPVVAGELKENVGLIVELAVFA